jgi:hypothetical protein
MWQLRLHITRALMAAGISLMFATLLPLLVCLYYAITGWSSGSGGIELSRFLNFQLQVVLIFSLLPLLTTLPMAALWFVNSTRRTMSVPWMAGICGGCLGILMSPVWFTLVVQLGGGGGLSVSAYLNGFYAIGPVSLVLGGLYFFLHSFFIRQALRKKVWEETRV